MVRAMVTPGLSERRALTVVHISLAALRYVSQPDPDPGLRDRIVALAHRHRRYGAGMIYLKLRQEGRQVNHKPFDLDSRILDAQRGRLPVGSSTNTWCLWSDLWQTHSREALVL